MQFIYASAANATTNGVALADRKGRDIYVKKLLIGLPVASGNIILYDKYEAYSGDTANIAFKTTLPSTISYQFTYPVVTEWDFTSNGSQGLQLDGGNLSVDQAMQVTVVWEYVDETK